MLGINTNIMSLNSQNALSKTTSGIEQAMQRLSSGLRINSAKDDAAGLGITDRMTTQIRGLNQAVRNAGDGISLAQTAEGAMQVATDILQRIRELSVQSANATNSDSDRASLQAEVAQLQAELTRISETTTFNGKKILDGSFSQSSFQVGANANETVSVTLRNTAANAIGTNQLDLEGSTPNTGMGRATAAATTAAANNVANGTTITVVGADSATVTLGANQSAREVASAINGKTSTTSVSADARTVARLQNLDNVGTVSFTLTADDGATQNSAAISAQITSTSDLQALADSINAKVGSTGISASLSDDKTYVDLVSENGDDIIIEGFDNSGDGAATDGMDVLVRDYGNTATSDTVSLLSVTGGGNNDSTRVMGEVRLSSTNAFTASASDVSVNAAGTEASTLQKVSDVDISTALGSQSALAIVDGALETISSLRGDLGAIQNRLEYTISNLNNVVENVSAARSRVQDADFAAETAALTRGQILQQAGVAMLAQANVAPQAALALLQ
jgi:flagellin